MTPAPPATPKAAVQLPADCAAVTDSSYDWTGRYTADEAVVPPPMMIMDYTVDVFRDTEGRWRAYIEINGQTTSRQLAACGVSSGKALSLRFVRYGPEDDHIILAPRDEPDLAPNDRILGIERSARAGFRMRFPSGSYLERRSVLRASREPLPPWRGRYTFDSCAGKGGGTNACWTYQIDVTLEDDGWKARVSLDSPAANERCEAWAEPWKFEDADGRRLYLEFSEYAPFDSHRGAGYKRKDPLATLLRKKDGSTVLQFKSLHVPPSLEGTGDAMLVATREARDSSVDADAEGKNTPQGAVPR